MPWVASVTGPLSLTGGELIPGDGSPVDIAMSSQLRRLIRAGAVKITQAPRLKVHAATMVVPTCVKVKGGMFELMEIAAHAGIANYESIRTKPDYYELAKMSGFKGDLKDWKNWSEESACLDMDAILSPNDDLGEKIAETLKVKRMPVKSLIP